LASSGMMMPFPCAILLAYNICAGLTGFDPSFQTSRLRGFSTELVSD
jgi:hypothetical protein